MASGSLSHWKNGTFEIQIFLLVLQRTGARRGCASQKRPGVSRRFEFDRAVGGTGTLSLLRLGRDNRWLRATALFRATGADPPALGMQAGGWGGIEYDANFVRVGRPASRRIEVEGRADRA